MVRGRGSIKIKFLLAVVILLSPLDIFASGAELLPSNNPKHIVISEVYERLVEARADDKPAPELLVYSAKARPDIIARYVFGEGSGHIVVGEALYDVFGSWTDEAREDALAVILAHELAHHFNGDRWGSDFGFAFKDLNIGREVMMTDMSSAETIKSEAHADDYGGMLGYLAGFDTLGSAPRVYGAVYTAFGLNDKNLGNYPKEAERQEIAKRSAERLKDLVGVFEAADRLLVTENYEDAARLFDYVASRFPSREILNNAGVARLLMAIELSDPAFVYPVAFDSETRLVRPKNMPKKRPRTRGSAQRSSSKKQAKIKSLLKEAKINFMKAELKDLEYAITLMNLAVVYDLLGEHEDAIYFSNKAYNMAEANGEDVVAANALIVRGIANANSGLSEEARKDFTKAGEKNRTVAALNIDVLDGKEPGLATAGGGKRPGKGEGDEEVGGLSLADLADSVDDGDIFEKNDKVATLYMLDEDRPEINLYVKEDENWKVFTVKVGSKTIFIIDTPEGYKESSARGVKVGDKVETLKGVYGEPSRIFSSRNETHHFYKESKVIFNVNAADEVVGWMLYERE